VAVVTPPLWVPRDSMGLACDNRARATAEVGRGPPVRDEFRCADSSQLVTISTKGTEMRAFPWEGRWGVAS
jgi:hypothetical protein